MFTLNGTSECRQCLKQTHIYSHTSSHTPSSSSSSCNTVFRVWEISHEVLLNSFLPVHFFGWNQRTTPACCCLLVDGTNHFNKSIQQQSEKFKVQLCWITDTIMKSPASLRWSDGKVICLPHTSAHSPVDPQVETSAFCSAPRGLRQMC